MCECLTNCNVRYYDWSVSEDGVETEPIVAFKRKLDKCLEEKKDEGILRVGEALGGGWVPEGKVTYGNLYDIDIPGDGSPALRISISITYSVVCATGLVGNLLVFFLMRLKQGGKHSTINFFILNLAVTDFQFVLTLPFWAVDTALDFSWPFGDAMCRIILSLTVMNMYASVFFLTAMGIARYWSVASALKIRRSRVYCSVKWVSFLLWVAASLATLPTAVFSTASTIAGENLCLLNFPDDGQYWLALYHIQKITLAFVLPMIILSICYLLLVRFLGQHHISTNNPKRKSRVTRSIVFIKPGSR
ncbi:relaxin-3 receptor 1 [Cetorhinus maximus]